MKTVRLSWILLLGIFVCGCATTGVERAERVQRSMQSVDEELQQTMVQIDATNRSLDNLVRPGQTELKSAYKDYKDNVARMEDQAKVLLNHTDEMRERRQNYFSEWQKEGETYTNPQIRALSEQRRLELARIFADIPESRLQVRAQLDPYLADIRSIEKYLTNDLTPKGITGVTPIAQQAVRDGENLKEAIRPMLNAISRARAELARGTTP